MAKVLLIYATRTNQTGKIGEAVAEGLRKEGVDVTVVPVGEFDDSGLDPGEFDGLVLGSATYHGEMMQPMKTLLFRLEKYDLEGKVGGTFGAFGWSGEAPGRIYDTMKNVFKMNMVTSPLRLQSVAITGGEDTARNYGREIASKLSS